MGLVNEADGGAKTDFLKVPIKMTVVCKAYWFFIGVTLQMISVETTEICGVEKMTEHERDVIL